MKPYDRAHKAVRFESKTDHHIRIKNRKILNWWEVIAEGTKKTERQKAKRIINEELVQYRNAS